MLGRIARSQRGAFMVFFAILVPFFLGMIGFAVDAGFVYMQKAKLQDIADAAALAGAARLNDGSDRGGNVTSAVKAYAAANGMKTNATNLFYLDNEASLSPSKNTFQIAHGILSSVMDKDNVQRDHVRVVIAKRVPTFFIGLLLPEEKEGVLVKAAAEAEYVEGEAPVNGIGSKLMTGYLDYQYNSKESLKMKDDYDFSITVSGGYIDFDKLPGKGTFYAWSQQGNKGDGREFYAKGYNATSEAAEKAKQIQEFYDSKESFYLKKCQEKIDDIQSHKQAVGKKRYIDKSMNNIVPGDDNIDLYINLNNFIEFKDQTNNTRWAPLLNNDALKGVKHIASLTIAEGLYGETVIDTDGISYGDIYCDHTLGLEGKNNYFNGVIYSKYQMYVRGQDNHFWKNPVSDDYRIFAPNGIHLGMGYDTAYDATGALRQYGKNSSSSGPSWRIYFGSDSSGSGSSGSSGSDTGTTAHVRLVK